MKKEKPEKTVLGIDPDTQASGWVLWQGEAPLAYGLIRTSGRLRGYSCAAAQAEGTILLKRFLRMDPPDLVVVEAQQHYPGSPVNANDLISLAACAGALIGSVASELAPEGRILTPLPAEWKGQVPKAIHHKRLAKDLEKLQGARFDGEPIPKGRFKEVADALGLALWGLRRA